MCLSICLLHYHQRTPRVPVPQVFDRMGQMRMYIFQARQIENDGWPGALFKWEDFSPSRYVSAIAGHTVMGRDQG